MTHLGVRMGCHAGSLCCLNAVSVCVCACVCVLLGLYVMVINAEGAGGRQNKTHTFHKPSGFLDLRGAVSASAVELGAMMRDGCAVCVGMYVFV